jgi:menaquinone-9 beta-reductase
LSCRTFHLYDLLMERVDVAIVGGGPAGASCAFFCAEAGLRTVVLERETFPREKVCGDCLNPACWPVFRRLGVDETVRRLPHGRLDLVEFIGIGGTRVSVELPASENAEIAVKRSLIDQVLLQRAAAAGAVIQENALVTRVDKLASGDWKIDIVRDKINAALLIAADGRNSSVARLRGLLPASRRDRVAMQTHIPLPTGFGNKVVLQFLEQGYSGQAAVNDHELNLCLVGSGRNVDRLKRWAATEFQIPVNHPWRTITPLTRPPLRPVHDNLLFIGDAARVVEPFTGEGIYYALRSGELAAEAAIAIFGGGSRTDLLQTFADEHAKMYRGRLWLNDLARAAVVWPRLGSTFVRLAKVYPPVLRLMTRKVVG